MTALSIARPRARLEREALICAAIAATIAAAFAWGAAPGTDFAAHAYQRALFLQHGFVFWDNFWYAGRYSFVTYSLLYYPLAAIFGIRLLAVVTVALAALAFAHVLGRQWGPSARWSSRSFAFAWSGIVLAAAFPFALGAAAGLLALGAAQRGRWRRLVLYAAVTLGASPLAFVLFVVTLGGIGLARSGGLRRIAPAGIPILALIALQGMLVVSFPSHGTFPFARIDFAGALAFAAVGVLLTYKVERARPLLFVFGAYLVLCVAAYAVPSELGANVGRIRYAAFPLALLVLGLRRWRPAAIAVPVAALALAWNVAPAARSFAAGDADVESNAAYWQPAVAFLRAHADPSYRVEAVDTRRHAPSFYLAGAGIPLARGWFRQDDFPFNALLYQPTLRRSAYLGWLRALSVRYVVLSTAPPDYSSVAEAQLLRSGAARLPVVFRTDRLTIFRVPAPRPLLTGPGPARVISFGHARIVVETGRRGTYRLGFRASPYWRSTSGCLAATADGMVALTTTRPGRAVLTFNPELGTILRTLGGTDSDCRPGTARRLK